MAPEDSIPLDQTLGATLRHHHEASLRQAAEIIRDHPVGEERSGEARRLAQHVMIEASLGRLTEEVRAELLRLLRPCCPDVFASVGLIGPPPPELYRLG